MWENGIFTPVKCTFVFHSASFLRHMMHYHVPWLLYVFFYRKMKVLLLCLLSTFLIGISNQQCTISNIKVPLCNRIDSTKQEINSIFNNCSSRADTSDHYNFMSVSILCTKSRNHNNTHEVRCNLQCQNGEWEIAGNQSTALRNNNTRYPEVCSYQTVNNYLCKVYAGKDDYCEIGIHVFWFT